MLSTIQGFYENGRIVMKEEPPVQGKTEVIITFLTQTSLAQNNSERQPGGLKGKVSIPVDFNAPLDDMKEYM